MANQLQFSTYLNPAGFARGIRDMEMLAGQAGGRISSGLSGGFGHGGGDGGGISGIIRESLVLIREFGRGNYTRMPGSATLLAQYLGGLSLLYTSTATAAVAFAAAEAKASTAMAANAAVAYDKAIASEAAAYAAGLNDAALIAEADAAAANATAMAADAVALNAKAAASGRAAAQALSSATITITAFGWIAIAAAAVAVPLYLVWRHFSKINEEKEKFIKATDATARIFSDEAKAAEEDAKAHAELESWLKKELDDRKSLLDVTERRLKQLRDEATAQRELARARGESNAKINAMEIGQLEKEKQLLEAAQARAKVELDSAKKAFQTAESNFTTNPTMRTADGTVDLHGAQRAKESAAKTIDEIYDSINSNRALTSLVETGKKAGGNAPLPMADHTGFWKAIMGDQATPAGTTIDQGIAMARSFLGSTEAVNKFGVTLQSATDTFNKNAGLVDVLTKEQERLKDAVEDGKMSVKDANAEWKKFTDQLNGVNDELGIKKGLGAQAAKAEDAKTLAKGFGHSDSLVSVGNFLGTARSGVETLASEHVRIARKSLQHLESMDRKMGNQGTHYSGS